MDARGALVWGDELQVEGPVQATGAPGTNLRPNRQRLLSKWISSSSEIWS